MKKLNVNQLKYLAAFFMVLDSMYLAFPAVFPAWLHLLTRFVAPLFAFFAVEGFFHTRDRKKYLSRLWLAAVLMQMGDYISFLLLHEHQITDNIFLTLAIGVSLIYVLETAKNAEKWKKILLYAAGVLVFLTAYAFSVIPITIGEYIFGLEAGIQIVSVITIFYLFYGNRKKQIIVSLIWNVVFILLTGVVMPSDYEDLSTWFSDFCFNCENLTFLFLPFLALYSGEKGKKNAFNRNFFYVLYPLHLWVLHVISALV